jgi:hypothetical protein
MYSTTPDGIFHGQMIKLRLEALKKEVPQPNEQGMVTLENGKQFQYQENMKLINWIPLWVKNFNASLNINLYVFP